MLTVISGMIGAGKSTYAEKKYLYFTDYDLIGSKTAQIEETLRLFDAGIDVAHITCFPTTEEMEAFERIPPDQIQYLWINTDQEQCRKNVLARARLRDLAEMGHIREKNKEYLRKYFQSKLNWQEINIFKQEQEERW